MGPILKMRCFLCLLRLSLPPEMGEMAQIFISEIEWLAALKCRATGLSTSLFPTERRCSANLSDRRRPRFTDVKFATFTARNAVNDVGGGACKIVPNDEIGFRSGNRCGRVEERTRVTTSTRARKGTRWCRSILSKGTAH